MVSGPPWCQGARKLGGGPYGTSAGPQRGAHPSTGATPPVLDCPGVLNGDRGTRAGKYLLLLEFESAELRDRYFPPPGRPSEALRRLAAVGARRRTLIGRGMWTDYVGLGR